MPAIVREESDRDPSHLIEQARDWLADDYFDISLEWGYRDLPRQVIAEPLLLGPDGGAPTEVEVFAFGGKAKLLRVLVGGKLAPNPPEIMLDLEDSALRFHLDAEESEATVSKQDLLSIVQATERVAAGFVHVRVDFYLTCTGLRIGKITPYNRAGHANWGSGSWNYKLGKHWEAAMRDFEPAVQ